MALAPWLKRKLLFLNASILSIVFFALLGSPRLAAQSLEELPAEQKAEWLSKLTPVESVIASKEVPNATDHDATILLNERLTSVEESGAKTIVRHIVYKSANEAGSKDIASATIGFRKGEEKLFILAAETIRPDGTRLAVRPNAILVQSPQRDADYSLYDDSAEVKILFPSVGKGSVTRYAYLLMETKARFPSEFTQSIAWQSSWPTVKARFQVDLPESMARRLKIESLGQNIPAMHEEKTATGSRFVWTLSNHPGTTFDFHHPSAAQAGPVINLSTIGSWDAVAAWFQRLVGDHDKLTPALSHELDRWVGEEKDRDKIIRILHQKVADDVRYVGLELGDADFQPHSCGEVWENGYGDCKDKANLLVALLNAKGIPACIVLLDTEGSGRIDRRIPSYRCFDHAIAAVPTEGGQYIFCDPTVRFSEPGRIGPSDGDRDVLIVRDGKAVWAHTPPTAAGEITYAFDLKLNSLREISGWFNYTSGGYYAYSERGRFQELSRDDLRPEVAKTVRGFFPGAEIIDATRSESSRSEPYRVKAYFISSPRGDSPEESIALTFPQSGALFNDLGQTAERSSIFTTVADTMIAQSSIQLPEGWEATSLPLPFKNESPFFSIQAKWQKKENTCLAEIHVETRLTQLSPVQFKEYYTAVQSVRTWLTQPVILKRAGESKEDLRKVEVPQLLNGDAQISIIDRLLPENGDHELRRQALAAAADSFAKDVETVFRAKTRVAFIDWNENKNAEAHRALSELLEKGRGRVAKNFFQWAELNDGLVLRDMGALDQAREITRRIAIDPDALINQRVPAATANADMTLDRDAAGATSMLESVIAAPGGDTPDILSRLIHAFLVNDQDESAKNALQNLVGSTADANEVQGKLSSVAEDAAGWRLEHDDVRRGKLVGLLQNLGVEQQPRLKRAIEFCRLEGELDSSKASLRTMIDTPPNVEWRTFFSKNEEKKPLRVTEAPIGTHVSPQTKYQMDAALRMLEAHATLRRRELIDPDSRANRETFRLMLQKILKMPPTPKILPPAILNPEAVVGSLETSFSVDSHGAAESSTALIVPKSRGDLAPKLSVNYYSGSAGVELGRSFSLSTGFHAEISRGRKLFSRDGSSAGVEYLPSDSLYLDGKLLVCTSGSDTQGRPGSIYRTEVDSFDTIVALGSGDVVETFVLTNQNGRKYYFGKLGTDSDALQADFDELTKVLAGVAHRWALKKVEDSAGNFTLFHYRHAGFGEWLLDRIDYVCRKGSQDPYTIQFHYAARHFPVRLYSTGLREDRNQILKSIEVVHNASKQVVAEYRFEYLPCSNPRDFDLLCAIQPKLASDFGRALKPLNPIRFNWSSGPDFAAFSSTSATYVAGKMATDLSADLLADFNGDGLADRLRWDGSISVSLGSADGQFGEPKGWLGADQIGDANANSLVRAGDIDADGRADVVLITKEKVRVFRSLGNGFVPSLDFELPPNILATYTSSKNDTVSFGERITLADFDGDGRDDVLVHGTDSKLYLFINEGTRFVAAPPFTIPLDSAGTPFKQNSESSTKIQSFHCDLNRDGMADYFWSEVTEDQAGVAQRLRYMFGLPGRTFSKPSTLLVSDQTQSAAVKKGESARVFVADLNGDGLDDVIFLPAAERSTGTSLSKVFLSRGRTTAVKSSTVSDDSLGSVDFFERATPLQVNDALERATFSVLDINDDNLADLVWLSSAKGKQPQWCCALGNGDGTFEKPIPASGSYWRPLTSAVLDQAELNVQTEPRGHSFRLRKASDIDGDGRADLTLEEQRLSDGSVRLLAACTSGRGSDESAIFPGLVTSITDGFGSRRYIAYRVAKDPSIYTPGLATSYPIVMLRGWQPVVAGQWRDNGDETISGFAYQYAGNHLDIAARGGLGFSASLTLDLETSFMKYQLLMHSFPMTGLQLRTQTSWFWRRAGKFNFKIISTEDRRIVFDAVADPFSETLWGTLFPFVSHMAEYREFADETATFSNNESALLSSPLESVVPPSSVFNAPSETYTDYWFDRQPLTAPSAVLPTDQTLPGLLTYGDVTRESSANNHQEITRTAKLYDLPPKGATRASMLKASMKAQRFRDGSIGIDAAEYNLYPPNSASYRTTVADGRDATKDADRNVTVVDYTRDEFGRLLEKSKSTMRMTDAAPTMSSSIEFKHSDFDPIADMPQTETGDDGKSLKLRPNELWQEHKQLTYSNGHTEVREYDELGRLSSDVNEATGYEKKTEMAWTNDGDAGWKKRKSVVCPSKIPGLTIKSVYAVRTIETGKPTTTQYFDCLSRVIAVVTTQPDGEEQWTETVYNRLGQEVATSAPHPASVTPVYHEIRYDPYGNQRK